MKTILVTGGAGFIGGNFVMRFVGNKKYRIINLDLLTYAGNLVTLTQLDGNNNHLFVKGDIGDKKLVSSLLAKYSPSAIVNFAAESHVDRSIDSPSSFIETNIVGTHNLLLCALKYYKNLSADNQKSFRFLHVSTDEVYGSLSPDEPPFTEKNRYEPNSPYSASKASADHLVRSYFATFDLPTLTTNCSNNYGPYQFPEKLVPLVIRKAIAGESIPVYGDGMQVRDWLYVIDHCCAINKVLESGTPGEVYNIGGNSEMTNINIVKSICNILDRLEPAVNGTPHEKLIKFVADRPGHDRRYAIDISKIEKDLSWQPSENFTTGMEKTVAWYLTNQKWCETVLADSYDEKRLGNF